jgi:hypothetical protein
MAPITPQPVFSACALAGAAAVPFAVVFMVVEGSIGRSEEALHHAPILGRRDAANSTMISVNRTNC